MPQMSPLMWANLFILFSSLLLLAFIKIYFSNSKNLEVNNTTMVKSENSNIHWMW